MKRRLIISIVFVLVLAINIFSCAHPSTRNNPPDITYSKLPRWRGFNLLEKFSKDWSNQPFVEEDFQLISELGFNFVRLPMDYRVWIKNNDWNQLDESVLQEIDQAVAWGEKYGIHVCLNFHRAPGYCVNPPQEPADLWTDPETQTVCAKHWAAFARRYRGISNRQLSFNLFNEPADIDPKTYAKVMEIMANAIRQEDPNRLIIADGIRWGTEPVAELVALKVAQSTRGYQPFWLSHYCAEWVEGSDTWALPRWPAVLLNPYLYGSDKPELTGALTLDGGFSQESYLRIRVNIVSDRADLTVKADDETVFEHNLISGPGEGEWQTVVYNPEWDIYQNIFNKDYQIHIPAATQKVTIEVGKGDWLSFSVIGICPVAEPTATEVLLRPTGTDWGIKPKVVYLDGLGNVDFDQNGSGYSKTWLWEQYIQPWKEIEKNGVGVIVGEWGAYNKTPHEVTLRWMKDCLENWEQAGWGWALWNFRGSFGVLDSDRTDVSYNDMWIFMVTSWIKQCCSYYRVIE